MRETLPSRGPCELRIACKTGGANPLYICARIMYSENYLILPEKRPTRIQSHYEESPDDSAGIGGVAE